MGRLDLPDPIRDEDLVEGDHSDADDETDVICDCGSTDPLHDDASCPLD